MAGPTHPQMAAAMMTPQGDPAVEPNGSSCALGPRTPHIPSTELALSEHLSD